MIQIQLSKLSTRDTLQLIKWLKILLIVFVLLGFSTFAGLASDYIFYIKSIPGTGLITAIDRYSFVKGGNRVLVTLTYRTSDEENITAKARHMGNVYYEEKNGSGITKPYFLGGWDTAGNIQRHHEGDTIPIRYRPDRPDKVKLAEFTFNDFGPGYVITAVIFFMLAFFIQKYMRGLGHQEIV